LTWNEPAASEVQDITREPAFRCVTNLSTRAIALPAGCQVLLAGGPLERDLLPPDTAVWLTRRPHVSS